MNNSDNDDIIETESSTDSKSNLNTKNQSEAVEACDSLKVTNNTSENEANESEQEDSKGQKEGKNNCRGKDMSVLLICLEAQALSNQKPSFFSDTYQPCVRHNLSIKSSLNHYP